MEGIVQVNGIAWRGGLDFLGTAGAIIAENGGRQGQVVHVVCGEVIGFIADSVPGGGVVTGLGKTSSIGLGPVISPYMGSIPDVSGLLEGCIPVISLHGSGEVEILSVVKEVVVDGVVVHGARETGSQVDSIR